VLDKLVKLIEHLVFEQLELQLELSILQDFLPILEQLELLLLLELLQQLRLPT